MKSRLATASLPLLILLLAGCSSSSDDSSSAVGINEGTREQVASVADQGDGNVITKGGCMDSDVLEERLIELVNEARSTPQQCGDVTFPAASAVSWSERAEAAAWAHSSEMASLTMFTHTGSNGSNVGDRLTVTNYRWRYAAENLAFGYGTPEGAVQGWMLSPGHCEKIMSTNVTEIGVSCADSAGEGDQSRRYWTQVLASPRS